ncbi:hypothetical protein Leryth_008892 [Lithospermum erythrorhizon]|nr:hypothetical protein Leryth_008892 [Lithospermum erythrorhizon]
MASMDFILTLIAVSSVFVAPSLATDYVVGDKSGISSTFNTNLGLWGKNSMLATILFSFISKDFNVYKVDGTGFKQCSTASLNEALISGSDVIPLATPGRKWYICGVDNHCADGKMKLVIIVLPPVISPAPAPAPYYW